MEDFPTCHAKHKTHAVQNMIIFSYYIYIPSPPFFFLFHPFVTKEVGMKGGLPLFLKDPTFTAEFLHT